MLTAIDIKEWRLEKGLTQIAAASALNISYGSWTNWERERSAIPSWLGPALTNYDMLEMLGMPGI